MKNSQFISQIRNDVNAINKDKHYSRSYILNIGQGIASFLIAQHWDEGRLFRDTSLYTYIDCLEMVKVNVIDCCFDIIPVCQDLMRSRYRIPGLLNSALGPAVISVTNLDNTIDFKPTSIKSYNILKKHPYAHLEENNYFYIHDDYIYIPDNYIEAINAVVVTSKRSEAKVLSGCKDKNGDGCKSFLDEEFVCPDRYLKYVIDYTLQELGIKVQIPQDENPNMDSNQISQTIQ